MTSYTEVLTIYTTCRFSEGLNIYINYICQREMYYGWKRESTVLLINYGFANICLLFKELKIYSYIYFMDIDIYTHTNTHTCMLVSWLVWKSMAMRNDKNITKKTNKLIARTACVELDITQCT